MKKVTVMQARDNMADIINNVSCGGERYKITRHGKERAVIISLEDWEAAEAALREKEDLEDIQDAMEALERIKTQGTISHDELWSKLGHDTCTQSNTTSASKKPSKNSQIKNKQKSVKYSKK